MGTFSFDVTTEPGIVRMVLAGRFEPTEMREFVTAHNRTIDELGSQPYRVWVDIRDLHPISPECAEIMELAKKYSAARPNFRGSAVHVASAMIAMQHRRTSISGGVMDTELISADESELRAHLAKVDRKR